MKWMKHELFIYNMGVHMYTNTQPLNEIKRKSPFFGQIH